MDSKSISRRKFLKETSAGALGASVVLPRMASAAAMARPAVDYTALAAVDRKQFYAAFGNTLIPTASGYPGYRRLEVHGITEEVMKTLTGIPADDLNVFNAAAMEFYEKPFVDLSETERHGFLERVAASFPPDTFSTAAPPSAPMYSAGESLTARLPKEQLEKVQRVFRLGRVRVMTVFYQNFPQHRIERDADKSPLLPPGDEHQIINPNTAEMVTGWDVANFPGPLTWQEEETRRAFWKKTHWHEESD